ncbi:MAG TPA: sulfotransferase family 2 domain-containing protein [Rhizomicrobium sp.]|nr:sulfotransferase family 2 domain-containing protein [Rhizomicrobium sp.]
MLLSLQRKFIFVANLKAASSTIEAALGPKAEIRMSNTKFGKHDGLSIISNRYAWVRRFVPYEEFFIFAVMRDPVDHLLSLYNSHQKEEFDGKVHSTKGMSFDDFLEVWCGRSWQARPQHLRFTDEHGRFKMSHVAMLEDLTEEFPRICEHLNLGRVELGRRNPSPAVLERKDLTAAQIDLVKSRYAEDYAWAAGRPRKL